LLLAQTSFSVADSPANVLLLPSSATSLDSSQLVEHFLVHATLRCAASALGLFVNGFELAESLNFFVSFPLRPVPRPVAALPDEPAAELQFP
jgi:hypothetical protein